MFFFFTKLNIDLQPHMSEVEGEGLPKYPLPLNKYQLTTYGD